MVWRVAGGLGALALLGGGLGYAASALAPRAPDPQGAATPLAAASPAYPFTPPVSVLPDPTTPGPLRAPFDTRTAQLGLGPFGLEYPIPKGWVRYDLGIGEARWVLPGNPDNTYSVRLELVSSEHRTPQQMVELRTNDLYDDTRVEDLRVLVSSADALTYTYVINEHRRVTLIRWVSPRASGSAEVEIAATGRLTDRAGLESLVGLIGASIQP